MDFLEGLLVFVSGGVVGVFVMALMTAGKGN